MKYISIVVLFTALLFPDRHLTAQLKFKTIESQKDWQSAKADAIQSGKYIFLDIYATWCGPCKKMDAEVYSVSTVADYYNSTYINLKVDGESEFGRVLASQYSLTGYPSMYFIGSKEELINVLVGYRDAITLNEAGRQVMESGKKYLELNELFKTSALTEEQAGEYMNLLAKFGKSEQLALLAGTRIKSFTEADILNPSNKAIVTAVISDIESFPANLVLKNALALKASWGLEDFNQYLSSTFDETMRKASESGDSLLMEKLAQEFVPVYMMDNPDRIPAAKLTTRKIFYSASEEWSNYIGAVEKYYNESEFGNLRFLYQEAYYIIENQINSEVLLTKALEWVEKVIAIQPDFESYFLAAIISTYRTDNDAIHKWMNKAGSVAVSEDQKTSLEELRKYIESQ